MRILFMHQNFPAQFRHLARHLSPLAGCEVVCMGEAARIHENAAKNPGSLNLAGYVTPEAVPSSTHPLLRVTEAGVRRGMAAAMRLRQLKQQGFTPDIIYTHPGWGDAMFAKDVFPNTPLLAYCEFYYNTGGQDVGFDPEFPDDNQIAEQVRLQNTVQLLTLAEAEGAISPTLWQRSRYPARFRDMIEVIHDGVDTDLVRPDPKAFVSVAERGLRLTPDDEIITFVNRNLEPCRGFHTFMRALPELLRRRPKAHVIIVGGDDVSYGKRPAKGGYREIYMREVGKRIDQSRVHFVGQVPYGVYINLLQVSTAHVYLTYPFVLSWSMVEAMAAGCAVIGSRTAPVEEVIRDGENGLLVDFFSPEQIVAAVERICEDPQRMAGLREAARRTAVEQFDLRRVCMPQQLRKIASLTGLAVEGLLPAVN